MSTSGSIYLREINKESIHYGKLAISLNIKLFYCNLFILSGKSVPYTATLSRDNLCSHKVKPFTGKVLQLALSCKRKRRFLCACAGKKLSQMAKKMQKVFPQNFAVFGTSYSGTKPNSVMIHTL